MSLAMNVESLSQESNTPGPQQLALPPRSICQFQPCKPCSPRRHRPMVHPRQYIHGLESVCVIVVGPRKTYNPLVSTLSPSLTNLRLHSRIRKSVLRFVTPITFLVHNINHLPAHLSFKISKASPAQDQLTLPISSSILGMTGSKMSALYFLHSLSNSAIIPILSATFSFVVIRTTNLARNNLMTARLLNVSWRWSRCQNTPPSILSLMHSMSVPIRREYRHRATRS